MSYFSGTAKQGGEIASQLVSSSSQKSGVVLYENGDI